MSLWRIIKVKLISVSEQENTKAYSQTVDNSSNVLYRNCTSK